MRRVCASILWVGVAAVCAALPGPPAASADAELRHRVVVRDPARDVQAFSESDFYRAPRVRTTDVTRVVATYWPRALWIRIRFADLRPYGYHNQTAFVANRNTELAATVGETPRRPYGRAVLRDPDDRVVSCPRFTHRVDYRADLVVMRVPRTCLGSPGWVRVYLSTSFWRTWRVDDMQYSDVLYGPWWSSRETYTPRLYRG